MYSKKLCIKTESLIKMYLHIRVKSVGLNNFVAFWASKFIQFQGVVTKTYNMQGKEMNEYTEYL